MARVRPDAPPPPLRLPGLHPDPGKATEARSSTFDAVVSHGREGVDALEGGAYADADVRATDGEGFERV